MSELEQIHLEILNLRALEYVLTSEEFRTLYNQCANRTEIDFYISIRDVNAVKFWMRGQRISELESYNVRQLRSMAQRLKIKDYHILTKNILISEIQNATINH